MTYMFIGAKFQILPQINATSFFDVKYWKILKRKVETYEEKKDYNN